MNRSQIERAEKIAERLASRNPAKRRELFEKAVKKVEFEVSARDYKKPASLAEERPKPKKPPKAEPEFTDRQLEIAMRSLDRQVS